MVPCFNKKDEPDTSLLDSIDYNEFSGLLNKILIYWDKLEVEGFGSEWDDIEGVRNKWEMDINPVSLFVSEECVRDSEGVIMYNDFFQLVNKFRVEHDAKPISKTMCTRELGLLGIIKTTNRKFYKGIRLKAEKGDLFEYIE